MSLFHRAMEVLAPYILKVSTLCNTVYVFVSCSSASKVTFGRIMVILREIVKISDLLYHIERYVYYYSLIWYYFTFLAYCYYFSREPDQALLQLKWHTVIAEKSFEYPDDCTLLGEYPPWMRTERTNIKD